MLPAIETCVPEGSSKLLGFNAKKILSSAVVSFGNKESLGRNTVAATYK